MSKKERGYKSVFIKMFLYLEPLKHVVFKTSLTNASTGIVRILHITNYYLHLSYKHKNHNKIMVSNENFEYIHLGI